MTSSRTSVLPRPAALVAVIVSTVLVAACSTPTRTESISTPGASPSVSDTPSATPTEPAPPPPYLKVPAGVELTLPGFALSLGDKATVAWKLPKPKTSKGKKKKAPIAAVSIRVKQVEAATLKAFAGWDLKKAARQSNPFFVRAVVTNVGKTDLSGVRMPFYIVDGNNTLIQASTFDGDFLPCASTPFPDKFKPGEKFKMCNVYLSPKNGRLTALSFRPTPKFDPITWTGETVPYAPKKKSKKDKKAEADQ